MYPVITHHDAPRHYSSWCTPSLLNVSVGHHDVPVITHHDVPVITHHDVPVITQCICRASWCTPSLQCICSTRKHLLPTLYICTICKCFMDFLTNLFPHILYEYWPTPHVILAFTPRESSTTENPIHHSATVLWGGDQPGSNWASLHTARYQYPYNCHVNSPLLVPL